MQNSIVRKCSSLALAPLIATCLVAAPGAAAQGAAAPRTPPSGASPTSTPAAPAGPLDPSKLPDIAGIHIGTPIDQIPALIKKVHADATIQPQVGYIRAVGIAVPDKQLAGVMGQAHVSPTMVDTIDVDYTWTPNKPVAFLVQRDVSYPQPLLHQNLLDALRQKYGKEIQAEGSSPANTGETNIDDNITAMWWLFDEQGRPIPRGPVVNHEPYGCIYVPANGQGYSQMVGSYLNKTLAPAGFCDSVIVLYAQFGVGQIGMTSTVLVDLALLRRSAAATGDWARAGTQQQQQQEMQKANQAKPNL